MKKKVLFISHDATRTGAPIIFLHLLQWLRRNTSITFDILLKDGGPLEEEFRALGSTNLLNWNNNAFDPALKEKFLRNLAKEDFGLIYSNTIVNGQILQLLAGADCPIISHIHELEYRISHQTKPEIIAGVTACTDHYIAASQAVKQNLVDNLDIPEGRIEVIYEFLPTETREPDPLICENIRKSLGIPSNSLIVGACGTSDWRKGPDLFIQLAALLHHHYGNAVHFCWLGAQVEAPEFSALEYDVKKANLDRYVHFIGPQQNTQDYFSLFDVFVSVSREDPFPLVNLEAATFGVPIVCFDNSGGAKEFVEHDCGCVVDYLNLPAMSARVMALLDDSDLRSRMGNQARNRVRQNHEVSVVAPKIMTLMETVISGWSSAARKARLRRVPAGDFTGNQLHDLFNILSDPLLSTERCAASYQQVGTKLQETGFFTNLYNLASWLDLKGEKFRALELYSAISHFAASANPELAGKAFYKTGCLADDKIDAIQSFRHCLEIYPAHKAARQRLHALVEDGGSNPSDEADWIGGLS